jgi:hypothetical protein
VLASACTARHDGPPYRTASKGDFGFNGGIATGVDYLACVNGDDFS